MTRLIGVACCGCTTWAWLFCFFLHIRVRNPYRGSQVQQPGCFPAVALVFRGPHAPSEFVLLTMFTVVSVAAVSCCCSFYQNDAARADCRKAGDPVLGAL